MALRNPKPVIWAPEGLSDALDGTEDTPGSANLLSNLIHAQNQRGLLLARVAATHLADTLNYSSGPLTALQAVGDIVYGFHPSSVHSGQDVPFAYNLDTSSFIPVSGATNSNLPTTPPSTGAWTPPTITQIGSRVIFTHPGFAGGSAVNTFFTATTGNTVSGSPTLTGYLWSSTGIPVGTQLYGAGVPAGATVSAWGLTTVAVTGSGTSGQTTFTVTSAAGIFVGMIVVLPTGQQDTVGSVSGTTIGLFSVTLSASFTSQTVTFTGATITMSANATATANTVLIYGVSPVSNKFGWLDSSSFTASISGNTISGIPIITGYFNTTGVAPGMSITGPNIPAGTTILACVPMTFNVIMNTSQGSTNVTSMAIVVQNFANAPPNAAFAYGQLFSGSGLPANATLLSVSETVGQPFGTPATGVLSLAATLTQTAATFTVSASIIILSQPATATAHGQTFAVAGGTPTTPQWGAGDLQINALASVPVFVQEYGGSACFGVNTTAPATAAVVISDAGIPWQATNASQVITFQNAIAVTAAAGLPLSNQLGGIIQSLVVFQGASNIQQITGVPALANVSVNTSEVATGTLAPNSIVSTPKGLMFVSPDGVRMLDFSGNVSNPIGIGGTGIVIPFQNASVPSRIAAAFAGNVCRITVQWTPPTYMQLIYGSSQRTDEFWLHLDTMMFSGPHTSLMDLITPWISQNSFVGAPQFNRGAIWRSDPYPNPGSSYVENGTQLTWTLRTVLLPDDPSLMANALVEASVWASMSTLATWAAAAIDDQGTTQASNTFAIEGPSVTQSQIPIYWANPIVFRQLAVQLSGSSEAQTLIGTIMLRYQKLKYPLPSYPVPL